MIQDGCSVLLYSGIDFDTDPICHIKKGDYHKRKGIAGHDDFRTDTDTS